VDDMARKMTDIGMLGVDATYILVVFMIVSLTRLPYEGARDVLS
jgi:hypothetical protein